jgi:hypothetical protein
MARIDHYEFGRIVIDGREETRDLIILPGRVVRNWWRRDGHALVLDDLVEVLEELPSHLVVGTGADGRMRPDPGSIRQLQQRGVTVEALPTGQAVRRFGELDRGTCCGRPPSHLLTHRAGTGDPVRQIHAALARTADQPAERRATARRHRAIPSAREVRWTACGNATTDERIPVG